MFLALKTVGVKQYEDSDFEPTEGVRNCRGYFLFSQKALYVASSGI